MLHCIKRCGFLDLFVEEWLWTLCDFVGKVMFSSSLMFENFLTIEQRRIIAMHIVEASNRCGNGRLIRGAVQVLAQGWPCLGLTIRALARAVGKRLRIAPSTDTSPLFKQNAMARAACDPLWGTNEHFVSSMSHELRTPLRSQACCPLTLMLLCCIHRTQVIEELKSLVDNKRALSEQHTARSAHATMLLCFNHRTQLIEEPRSLSEHKQAVSTTYRTPCVRR